MIEQNNPRIFLCHASEDKPQVKKLYHQLKEAGYHPWLDKYDLIPGQNWRHEIRKLITHPYNVIVVCLSQHSTTKRGVVQQEIKWALDILDQMPEDIIYLIPARLEPCQAPDRLSSLHWVDLFEQDGFDNLKRALDHEIGRRRTATKSEIIISQNKNAQSPDFKEIDNLAESSQETIIRSPKQRQEKRPLTRTRKSLKVTVLPILRDPIWQMVGVIVAIITLVWGVYTFYIDIEIPSSPPPTPTVIDSSDWTAELLVSSYLRPQPDNSSVGAILLPEGDLVDLLTITEDRTWVRVKDQYNRMGWMEVHKLKLNISLDTLPVREK